MREPDDALLYKEDNQYILLIRKIGAHERYEALCDFADPLYYDEVDLAWVLEHGDILVQENAISVLGAAIER